RHALVVRDAGGPSHGDATTRGHTCGGRLASQVAGAAAAPLARHANTRCASRRAAKQGKRAGVAVEECRTADPADLAIAEEPADRHVSEVFPEQPAIVIRLAKQMFAAAQTREQQRTVTATAARGAMAFEQPDQVLGRRPGVAQEEPDDL